jgi:type II secretory pathway component PulF
MIVIIGALVCVLALGVFLPMWEMISKASAGGG